MIVKFPNRFALGSLAYALADLDPVTPVDLWRYGLFGTSVPSIRGDFNLPRSGVSDWLKTDRELRAERSALALNFAGNSTVH